MTFEGQQLPLLSILPPTKPGLFGAGIFDSGSQAGTSGFLTDIKQRGNHALPRFPPVHPSSPKK